MREITAINSLPPSVNNYPFVSPCGSYPYVARSADIAKVRISQDIRKRYSIIGKYIVKMESVYNRYSVNMEFIECYSVIVI